MFSTIISYKIVCKNIKSIYSEMFEQYTFYALIKRV